MPDDRYQGRQSSDRPSFSGPRQFSGPGPTSTTATRGRPSGRRPEWRFRPRRSRTPCACATAIARSRSADRRRSSVRFSTTSRDVDPTPRRGVDKARAHRPAGSQRSCGGGPAASRARERARAHQAGGAGCCLERQAHDHTEHAGRQGAGGAQGIHATPRGGCHPKAPRRQLHAPAGAPHPRTQRSEGIGHRQAAGHLPSALTSLRAERPESPRGPIGGAVVWRQGGWGHSGNLSAECPALWSGGRGRRALPLSLSVPWFRAMKIIALARSLPNSLSAAALWSGGRGLGTHDSACPLPSVTPAPCRPSPLAIPLVNPAQALLRIIGQAGKRTDATSTPPRPPDRGPLLRDRMRVGFPPMKEYSRADPVLSNSVLTT